MIRKMTIQPETFRVEEFCRARDKTGSFCFVPSDHQSSRCFVLKKKTDNIIVRTEMSAGSVVERLEPLDRLHPSNSLPGAWNSCGFSPSNCVQMYCRGQTQD